MHELISFFNSCVEPFVMAACGNFNVSSDDYL